MLAKARGGDQLGPQSVGSGLVSAALAMRYDVNPCDVHLDAGKADGLQDGEGRRNRSMRTGLEGWKGEVRIAEGPGDPHRRLTPLTEQSWEDFAARADTAMEPWQD